MRTEQMLVILLKAISFTFAAVIVAGMLLMLGTI